MSEMHLEPLTQFDQIKIGDPLLVSDGRQIFIGRVKRILLDVAGTEVVFNLRNNHYFNVGMYLKGESWAKCVRIVRNGVPS